MVQIEMENGGIIKLELYPEAAPITVENFVNLAKDGFYDGLIFHRVIKDFMIQGGDPEGTGMGGSDTKIKGEFSQNGWNNPISHKRGVISMARSRSMDSASSQFFICHADSTYLDGQYAAFGKVTEGMDVVDEIASVETDKNDRPVEDVVIKSITVIED
ncbi:MAG: peptidylprolyl isomerase [Eubacteriales bacterium]